MRQFMRAFTTTIFAVHAIVGCCAHHACGAGVASHDAAAASHSGHDCAGDDSMPQEPSEHGQPPLAPCHHEACSFVKVQLVRIDDGCGQALWVTAASPAAGGTLDMAWQSGFDGRILAASFAAPVYVRFCALLI